MRKKRIYIVTVHIHTTTTTTTTTIRKKDRKKEVTLIKSSDVNNVKGEKGKMATRTREYILTVHIHPTSTTITTTIRKKDRKKEATLIKSSDASNVKGNAERQNGD